MEIPFYSVSFCNPKKIINFFFVFYLSRGKIKYNFLFRLISFTHQVEFFFLIFFCNILTLPLVQLLVSDVSKPDLVCVVSAHLVYFCAYARLQL